MKDVGLQVRKLDRFRVGDGVGGSPLTHCAIDFIDKLDLLFGVLAQVVDDRTQTHGCSV